MIPKILAHGDLGASDEILVGWLILNVAAFMAYNWWKTRKLEDEETVEPAVETVTDRDPLSEQNQ